jgi:hypothetical protein
LKTLWIKRKKIAGPAQMKSAGKPRWTVREIQKISRFSRPIQKQTVYKLNRIPTVSRDTISYFCTDYCIYRIIQKLPENIKKWNRYSQEFYRPFSPLPRSKTCMRNRGKLGLEIEDREKITCNNKWWLDTINRVMQIKYPPCVSMEINPAMLPDLIPN